MRSFCSTVSVAVLAVLSLTAHASPITYTETVIADGSLGATNFTGQLVTITGIGDTSGIGLLGPGVFFLDLTSATVQIGAGPVVTLTDPLMAIANHGGPTAGLGANFGDLLDATSSAFSSYGLDTAISASGITLINPGLAFATSAGDFDMLSTGSNTTFTATLGTAAAPEPSSIALLAMGLLGLAHIARRKTSNSSATAGA